MKTEPGEVVVSAERIAERVAGLAREIEAASPADGEPLVLVCVLRGSIVFTADLARALRIPVEIDTVAVRSYDGTASTGSVELVKDVSTPLRGRDVLVVEDVIDTGLTTAFLLDHLGQHRPRSLRLVALLDKQGRRVREVTVDFRGFVVGDAFVVGYGLDLDQRFRNLPDVHAIDAG